MNDVVFIIPNNSAGVYQELSGRYSAIETPTWALLLAESCRAKGFKVKIIDCLAENLTDKEALVRLQDLNPRLISFVVYGQNVNAGTTNMVVLQDYQNTQSKIIFNNLLVFWFSCSSIT